MIKSCGLPGRGGMTGAAVRAKTAIMVIIFLVAGITVAWGAFKKIIGMTIFALYAAVSTGQFKG